MTFDVPQPPKRGPNCWDCRYLAITWDSRVPYACGLMGFRSRVLPSLEVLRTDGRFCGGFAPKLPPANRQNSKDKSKSDVGEPSSRRKNDPKKRVIRINIRV
jgi:hypothetical protein